MVRTFFSHSWIILAFINLTLTANGQVKNAYQLLPDSTQAVIWIPNTDELIGRWDRTQLSKLATDDAIKPFWEDQKQEIERRFLDAGWRLNIKPQDLSKIAEGQLGVAWVESMDPKKPFGLALIVDIVEDRNTVDDLLNRIDKELVARKSKVNSIEFEGETIKQYSLSRPGELLIQETFYSIVDKQLLSADDLPLIKDMIQRAKGIPNSGKTLDTDSAFVEGRNELKPSNKSQIEYFVRPIGFAKVLRAIGGKLSNSNTDLLAVLANQGFSSIRCVSGEITLGGQSHDIQHRGFTLIEKPLPKSAGVLDFPNKAKSEIPNFVTKDIETLLVGYWNSQEAFWKVEGLVDEMAGQPGVFKSVIDGIKTDKAGPRIDIKNEVLPYIANDIFSISDTVEPITTNSHRNLIAVRLTNADKLKEVLRRAMKQEPDTKLVEGEDEIWKKVHQTEADNIQLGSDFGDFGATDNASAGGKDPLLSSWAIAIHGDYFMFASHVEMIQDAIKQAKSGKESPLASDANGERMRSELSKVFGDDPNCFWQIVRSELSYRMQYELFRNGELDKSESMLASVLDRLLQNNTEIKSSQKSKIDGARLPKFEQISHYLQPSGLIVQTKENGWAFGSLLLTKQDAQIKADSDLSGPQSRISNADAESNGKR